MASKNFGDEGNIEKKSVDLASMQRPWLRFLARYFDWVVFFLLLRLIGFPYYLEGTDTAVLLRFIFTIPLEAFCISSFGTTLGKLFGGINVKRLDGGNPTFFQALKRTSLVWVQGCALGIPIINLVSMWLAKNKVNRDNTTWWDETCGTIVECKKIPVWRYMVLCLVSLTLFICINIAIIDYIWWAYIK